MAAKPLRPGPGQRVPSASHPGPLGSHHSPGPQQRRLADAWRTAPWDTGGMQTLLVASAGGHLEELWLLHSRLVGLSEDRLWVTWDTPQSRSLLVNEQRVFIPWCRPRDLRGAWHNARIARHILALRKWKDVVTTGSAPAVPFVALARARGITCHFIESAARVRQPSLSAALIQRIPGLHCYSQYRWPDRPSWEYRGSVFDAFYPVAAPERTIRRVVVSLGANQYGFRRLVASLVKSLPRNAEVLWQTGATDVSGLGIAPQPFLPEDRLQEAMRQADLVVCHGGVGSALSALRAGHRPLLVPRRRAFGEHVDEHQSEITKELSLRGLAATAEADDLPGELLHRASAGRVLLEEHANPFVLNGPLAHKGPDNSHPDLVHPVGASQD